MKPSNRLLTVLILAAWLLPRPLPGCAQAAPSPQTRARNLLSAIEQYKVFFKNDGRSDMTSRFLPGLHEIKEGALNAQEDSQIEALEKRFLVWKDGFLAYYLRSIYGTRFADIRQFETEAQRRLDALNAVYGRRKALAGGRPELALMLDKLKARINSGASSADLGALYDNLGLPRPSAVVEPRPAGDISAARFQTVPVAQAAPQEPEYSLALPYLRSQGVIADSKEVVSILRVIKEEAAAAGADWLLTAAMVLRESHFNRWALGGAGEYGLMQLMPGTWSLFGAPRADPFDARANIRAGIRYMGWLWAQFAPSLAFNRLLSTENPWARADVKDAIAAYNAGPGNARRRHFWPRVADYVRGILRHYTLLRNCYNKPPLLGS
ncbi:MAG: lytic transglycosylase domain-containing protein [Elusimicrobia bacterium]|nr:lytic transglycosylase domain-containing protein [Elusimicrobiota bacterium]